MQELFPSAELRRFHEYVIADPRLFERLTNAPDAETFVARVVAAGTEHGVTFTADEVCAAVTAARRDQIEQPIQ